MNEVVSAVAHSAAFRGALAGAVAAAVVDVHAFLTWKRFQDVITYDWGTAVFRWLQGAVSGALVGGGYGSMIN
jgi:hypothetical protein